MGQSHAASAMDRLPWLPDEPARQAKRRSSGLAAWVAVGAAAAILLVAAAFYWLGLQNGHWPSRGSGIATTVALPPAQIEAQPQSVAPQPEVKLDRVPEVEPIVAPPMPVVDTSPAVRRPLIKSVPMPQPTDEVMDSGGDQAKAAASAADPLKLWPVRVIDGAAGRLVRVGTFSSAHRAKKGWWAIVRMNPALKRLPALVVPVRSLRNGKVYFRLQMGTTSQAHSEVLCQRMRMIAQSCVVIGIGDASEAAAK